MAVPATLDAVVVIGSGPTGRGMAPAIAAAGRRRYELRSRCSGPA